MWEKLKLKLRGWRTIIAANLYVLAGALVGVHDFIIPYIAGIDWQPVTRQVPDWAWPFIVVGTGALFGWLRTVTTGPVGGKGD
jgi:hypothetical protein